MYSHRQAEYNATNKENPIIKCKAIEYNILILILILIFKTKRISETIPAPLLGERQEITQVVVCDTPTYFRLVVKHNVTLIE
jgi:hypothetical protein